MKTRALYPHFSWENSSESQLPLITTMPELICDICADTKPASAFAPLASGCSHEATLCRDCLKRHVDERLNKNDTMVRCPAANGCGAEITHAHLMRALGAADVCAARFDRVATNLFLRSLPEFRFCAHDCGSGQLVEGGEEAASFMTCAHCAGRTCMRHERTRWHDGVTCDEYDQALARAVASGDDGAEAALAEAAVQVKACPGCGTRISKADGCDVMRCCGRGGDDECRRYTRAHGACTHNPNGGRTHCGQRFCWLCLGKIDEDGTRHHARTCQWHESNL